MVLLPWLHCAAKAQPKPKKFAEGSPEKHELGSEDFFEDLLWGYAAGGIVDCSLKHRECNITNIRFHEIWGFLTALVVAFLENWEIWV